MNRAILLILAACGPAHAGDGIRWKKDLDTAMAASVRDGRPVLLYFTFDT